MLQKRSALDKTKNHISAGDEKFNAKDYNGAILHYRKAVESDPYRWEGYYKLALTLYYQKKYPQAIEAYDQAIQRNNTVDYVFGNRGLAKRYNENYAGAIKDFREAIRLDPDDYYPYRQLGLVYLYGLKEYDKAIAAYNKALEYIAENHKYIKYIYSELASSLFKNGNHNESFEIYERLVAQNPESAYFFNDYAYNLALASRDLDKAEEMILRALEKKPENDHYLDTAGWVYYKKGNYQKADFYIGQAIEKGPPSAENYEHMGWVKSKLNQTEEAAEWWKKACELGGKTACEKIEL